MGALVFQKNFVSQQGSKGFVLSDDTSLASKIVIVSGDKVDEELTLQKQGNEWMLPQSIKADSDKIVATLNSLTKIKPSWPVATTQESHQRFEVSEDKFQRKVSLAIGSNIHTFYMGTSPGYRQVHVRMENAEEVYAVQLNIFDFSAEAKDWFNRNQLQIKDAITEIKSNSYDFKLNDTTWELIRSDEPANSSEVISVMPEKAKEIVKTLNGLKMLSINEINNIAQPTEQLIITTDKQQEITYKLLAREDDAEQLIQKKGDGVVYSISQDTYDKLVPAPKVGK